MQARDRIIDLANIDALKVVRLPLLTTQTALVNTLSDVSVAKLAVHRLNEAELAPPSADIHLHRVLLRAVHHGVVRRRLMIRNNPDVCPRINRGQSRTHAHHHFRRLRAGVDGVVFGSRRLATILSRVGLPAAWWLLLSVDLARLANPDAFALPSDLHVGVGLAADDNVVLYQLDRVVLAVVPVLRRESSKLLRIQNLVVVAAAPCIALLRILLGLLLATCLDMAVVQTSLCYRIAILSIVVDLEVANLHDSLVLADVDTCTCVCVLRADIKQAVLAPGRFRDVNGVFITFLFLVWIRYALFRLVDRGMWLLGLAVLLM